MNVIDLINPDWKSNNNKNARDMVDYGVSFYQAMNSGTFNGKNIGRISELSELYRAYHGKYSASELEELAKVHGIVSSTKFQPYRMAKIKMEQILGEALEVGFSVEVDTVSHVEKEKKKQQQATDIGRAYAKPIIESMREQGMNIYEGMNIPSLKEYKENPTEVRSQNELISQRIANEKIKDCLENNVYYNCFASNIFASEIFSLITEDRKGRTTIKVIEPERMIYPITAYDQFGEEFPIIGHWEYLTYPEIIRRYNIRKGDPEFQLLKDHFSTVMNMTSGAAVSPMNSDGSFNLQGATMSHGGTSLATMVFNFQWRYYVEAYYHEREDGSYRFYKKEDVDAMEETERSSLKVQLMERIYCGSRLAFSNVYFGFHDQDSTIHTPDSSGSIHAEYDYVCTFVKSFGNMRTSYARVVTDIGKTYDEAKWMLRRELRKSRSSAIYINRQYLDKQGGDSFLHELEDEGVVNINSNTGDMESDENAIRSGNDVVGSISSGSNTAIIRDLLSVLMSIEQTMDNLSGINAARKGVEQATATATTAQNNLQASRSVTYDYFYFTENHMQRCFTKLIQKIKFKLHNGSKELYGILDPEDITYIENSPDYLLDSFAARFVGGRRSQQIFSDLNRLLESEVAAGKRSSADYILIRQTESLTEAERVLRESDEKLQGIQQQAQQSDNDTKTQMNQQSIEAQDRNREDTQQHEIELQDMKNQSAREIEQMRLQKQAMAPPKQTPILPEGMGNTNKAKSKK